MMIIVEKFFNIYAGKIHIYKQIHNKMKNMSNENFERWL